MKKDDNDNEIQINSPMQNNKQKFVCVTSGRQTTTAARLRLYSEIEKLGERCFYMDTDSILFLQSNDNEYCPKLDAAVGGLSNELEKFRKKGSEFEPFIDEYICLGPKTYAYSVITEPENSPTFKKEIIVRCKGLSLKGKNAKLINMNLLKSFVLGQNLINSDNNQFYFEHINTEQKCIRPIKEFRVVTRTENKKFQFTFDKRVVSENLTTYPYGYISNCNQY